MGVFDPFITMSIIRIPFCNLYSSLIVQFLTLLTGLRVLLLTNTERCDQSWGQFPNSVLVRKWSLFLKMRDWQLLTLQNWTTLPLFKQNVSPEQVVGKPHCQFSAFFPLASRWCYDCKCATFCQHPIIMAAQSLCGDPGSRARSLALYKCIYTI